MPEDIDVQKIVEGHEVQWDYLTTREIEHEVRLRQRGLPGEWGGSPEVFIAAYLIRKGRITQ